MLVMIEDYINNYINNHFIITGCKDDIVLSCHIKYDLINNDISYKAISKTLLKNKSITKKIMRGSMHYMGIRYKESNE
jgi:hypothetical protein